MSAPPRGGPGQRSTSDGEQRPTQTGTERAQSWVLVTKGRRPLAQLRSQDWSVPVVEVKALQEGAADGVAIASYAEARATVRAAVKKDGKGRGAQAIVVLGVVKTMEGATSQTAPVVVKRGLRTETLTASIFQLGAELVSSRLAQKNAEMPQRREERRLSIRVPRNLVTEEQWEEAGRDLRAYLRQFAADAGVAEVTVTGVETRGRANDPTRYLGALIRATEADAEVLEKASGKAGVFAVPKGDAGPVIWLASNVTLAEAEDLLRNTPGARRIACNRRGLGLRVEPGREESIRAQVGERGIRGEKGKVWDAQGFE